MDKAEIIDIVTEHVESCQIKMEHRIDGIVRSMHEDSITRNTMNTKLDTIAKQAQDNHKAFSDHDKREMEKYDEVISSVVAVVGSVNELTKTVKALMKETAENTGYVQSETYNRRIEDAVKIARKKDREKSLWRYIDKALPSIITVSILGLFSLVWIGITTKISPPAILSTKVHKYVKK
jgi:hypothetical protein